MTNTACLYGTNSSEFKKKISDRNFFYSILILFYSKIQKKFLSEIFFEF